MSHIVDHFKSKGEFEIAGRVAKSLNEPRYYGCHFGMRSTLERDRETFFKAYDSYVVPTSYDVYWWQGLYEANCSKERIAEIVGTWDHHDTLAAYGYANDYCDVEPICIMPHGVELHVEGKAHIKANGEK